MKIALLAFLLLITTNAHALGPIPNGTFEGVQSCVNERGDRLPDGQAKITFGDTTMDEGPFFKDFTLGNNGFFKLDHYNVDGVTKVKTLNGKGSGYFTKTGMHFDVAIDFGGKPVPGEDTFLYSEGKIYLISSTFGYKCESVLLPTNR